MKLFFTASKRRHPILRISVLLFLLQMVAPAFQAVLAANSVKGYTQTICTMTGQKTVFVALEEDQKQNGTNCSQCAACLIHVNLNGLAAATPFIPDARYRYDSSRQIESIYLTPGPRLYPHFLSRAPPA